MTTIITVFCIFECSFYIGIKRKRISW